MKIVVIAFISVVLMHFSSCSEDEECFKVYLDTLRYDQSRKCEDLFVEYLQSFNDEIESAMKRNDNRLCIRRLYEEYHFDEIFLRGLSKQKINDVNEFSIMQNMKSSIDTILFISRNICNDENALQSFVTTYLENYSMENIHLENCMLKHLAERKFFDLNLLRRNPEIMSVKNCRNMTAIIEEAYQVPQMTNRELFGMIITDEDDRCFEDALKFHKLIENSITCILIQRRVQLTTEQHFEWKNKGLKVFQKIYTEELNCFSKMN